MRPVRLPGTEKTRSKYGARRRTVDGMSFASGREANRWFQLEMMQKAGQIRDLHRQVAIELHTVRDAVVGRYIADATYIDLRTNRTVWEDCKGFKTPLYRWKKRHIKAEYGIDILET